MIGSVGFLFLGWSGVGWSGWGVAVDRWVDWF